ncbi:MAG TPA: hypothetical protein PLN13_00550 [Bacteroidia bacterium]|nr:hypothetical protein [Bacteroidia bacterium]HRH07041.1 hypothetical protein [Bacteroidia bacterium]
MKSRTLLTIILITAWLNKSYSQIKVYAGGNTYIGSTSVAAPTNKLHVVGNSVFTSGTGVITSAP